MVVHPGHTMCGLGLNQRGLSGPSREISPRRIKIAIAGRIQRYDLTIDRRLEEKVPIADVRDTIGA